MQGLHWAVMRGMQWTTLMGVPGCRQNSHATPLLSVIACSIVNQRQTLH